MERDTQAQGQRSCSASTAQKAICGATTEVRIVPLYTFHSHSHSCSFSRYDCSFSKHISHRDVSHTPLFAGRYEASAAVLWTWKPFSFLSGQRIQLTGEAVFTGFLMMKSFRTQKKKLGCRCVFIKDIFFFVCAYKICRGKTCTLSKNVNKQIFKRLR